MPTFNISLQANNSCVGGLPQSTSLGVGSVSYGAGSGTTCPMPGAAAPFTDTLNVGQGFVRHVALNNVTGASLSPVPAGMGGSYYDPANSRFVITGTATTVGANQFNLILTNNCGTGTTTQQTVLVGTLNVNALGSCPISHVARPMLTTNLQVGLQWAEYFIIGNCTAGIIGNKPSWMNIDSETQIGNDRQWNVSGNPTAAATIELVVTSTNACANGSPSVSYPSPGTLVVSNAPAPLCPAPNVVTGVPSAPIIVNTPFSYDVVMTAATTATLHNPPAGVTGVWNAGTQTMTVSGSLSANGSYPIYVRAENACGGGSTTYPWLVIGVGSLTVVQPNFCPFPALLQDLSPNAQVGQPYSALVKFSNTSQSMVRGGLPPGLSWDTPFAVGTEWHQPVSGTPTQTGTWTPSYGMLTNACGGGNQTTTSPGGNLAQITVATASGGGSGLLPDNSTGIWDTWVETLDQSPAFANIALFPDGRVEWQGTFGTSAATNWRSPTLAGVGNGVWVRITRTRLFRSPSGVTIDGTFGTWQQLSGAVTVGSSVTSTNYCEQGLTFEFSLDGGTSIASTISNVTCASVSAQ